jgi:hemoglobin-like flavoprotein
MRLNLLQTYEMKNSFEKPDQGATKVPWCDNPPADSLTPEMKHSSESDPKSRPARNSTSHKGKAARETPPLDEKQIQLLRASFARIQPQADIAALAFYRNLFALAPSLRALFHSSIELQGRKLMEALSYTIATLENPRELTPVLESLGRRHVAYGAKEEHYPVVAAALLQTLAEILANDFTPDVRRAWRDALAFVADVMKRGASKVEQLSQSTGL